MRQVHVEFWDRSDGGKFTVPGFRLTAERDRTKRGTGADPLYEHEDPETFRLVSCAMQLLEMAVRRADERRISTLDGPRMGEIHEGTPCFDGGEEVKP